MRMSEMSDNPERHGVRTRSQLPTAQLVSTSVSIVDTSLSMFVPRKRGLYIIRGLATFFFCLPALMVNLEGLGIFGTGLDILYGPALCMHTFKLLFFPLHLPKVKEWFSGRRKRDLDHGLDCQYQFQIDRPVN